MASHRAALSGNALFWHLLVIFGLDNVDGHQVQLDKDPHVCGLSVTLGRAHSHDIRRSSCPRSPADARSVSRQARDRRQCFLPERDYVTFGSLLSQFRLSSVCLSVCRLSSVTLVHPTQGVEPFGKISSPLCTLAIL